MHTCALLWSLPCASAAHGATAIPKKRAMGRMSRSISLLDRFSRLIGAQGLGERTP